MKFFILSDIHGSVPAFEKAMRAFEAEKADWLILCGDYLNHGPRNPIPEGYDPPKLAPMINAFRMKIMAVRGNCDSEVDQMLLTFPCTGDYLMFFTGARRCFVTHGHLFNKDSLPPLQKGDIFISGHTHVPVLEEQNGIVFLNPGSPSIPKEGSAPGYAVMDENGISLKKIDGTEITAYNLR
jgi:putative phosphoesterase